MRLPEERLNPGPIAGDAILRMERIPYRYARRLAHGAGSQDGRRCRCASCRALREVDLRGARTRVTVRLRDPNGPLEFPRRWSLSSDES
jgi:hypothetical protein